MSPLLFLQNKLDINIMNKYFILLLLLSLFISCSDSNEEVKPGPPPVEVIDSNLRDGITIISEDSLAFVLYAPYKNSVHLIGGFSGWEPTKENKMHKDGDRFWLKVGNLDKNKEYVCQYLIDNTLRIADPYASKISDPYHDQYIKSSVYPNMVHYPAGLTTEIAMVVSTKKPDYKWKVKDFKFGKASNMTVYELLIRDFTKESTISAAKEKIPYLKSLGVTAIELMPFNEFEGNDSWGYNPSFYFATDKAYGNDEAYKSFIDECHKNGIAVIMDMVLNHAYGQCSLVRMYEKDGKVTNNNPWFNVVSPNSAYSWGYDFNHESKKTQQFVDSVCSFWMSEFKIDGFRFDFTKGFTNTSGDGWAYDDRRIALLKRMANEIKQRKSDAVIIFEHLTDNREEKELAEHGIYLWGNMNYNFNEATMGWGGDLNDNGGYKGDLSWASYKKRDWNSPHLVSYMESHDEERLMFKNKSYGATVANYDVKKLETGLQRTAAAAVIYMSIPGPKMIWQFGELGYDYELNDDRVGRKPVRWDYYDVPARKALYDVFATMNTLRQQNDVFKTTDFNLNLSKNYKSVLLKSRDKQVCVIANFGTLPQKETVDFGEVGIWEEYFTKDKMSITTSKQVIELNPGEYRLYMK